MAADNALKKGIAAVSVLLIAAAAAVGVYAYLGDKQTAENKMTVAEGSVSIVEEFSSPDRQTDSNIFQKEVKIANTGTSDCFVRVYMDFSDSRIKKKSKLSSNGTVYYDWSEYITKLPADWIYCNEDNALGGYFYYKKIVPAGGETTELVKSIKTVYESGNLDDISDFDIIVYTETVQTVELDGTQYTDNNDDWKKAWSSFLKVSP